MGRGWEEDLNRPEYEPVLRCAAEAVPDRWGRKDAIVHNAGSFYALDPVAEVNATKWWWDVKVKRRSVVE
jgi:NADP-dependent 3-hydroxy acid dehydrogenase YdfG